MIPGVFDVVSKNLYFKELVDHIFKLWLFHLKCSFTVFVEEVFVADFLNIFYLFDEGSVQGGFVFTQLIGEFFFSVERIDDKEVETNIINYDFFGSILNFELAELSNCFFFVELESNVWEYFEATVQIYFSVAKLAFFEEC